MLNYAKGYTQLSERQFNSINYTTLFCCLAIIGVCLAPF